MVISAIGVAAAVEDDDYYDDAVAAVVNAAMDIAIVWIVNVP